MTRNDRVARVIETDSLRNAGGAFCVMVLHVRIPTYQLWRYDTPEMLKYGRDKEDF
jgi:hypothetical protein